MTILRDYQLAAIDKLRENIRAGHKAQVLVLPTGGGKTVVATHLMQEADRKLSKSCFVVDRRAIVNQTSATFDRYGLDHGVIMADHLRNKPFMRTQVASAQTLEARGFMPDLNLLVVDECITGDALIATPDGPVAMSELCAAPRPIYCLNELTGLVGVDKPVMVWSNGTRDVSLIQTDNGAITCTSTHRFYVNDSWLKAGDLAVGMRLHSLDSSDSPSQRLRRASAAVAVKLCRVVRSAMRTLLSEAKEKCLAATSRMRRGMESSACRLTTSRPLASTKRSLDRC